MMASSASVSALGGGGGGATFGAEFPVAERRAELTKMKMADLKPMCKGSGLKMGGKKSDLVDRLLEHEFGTTDDEADIDPRADVVVRSFLCFLPELFTCAE